MMKTAITIIVLFAGLSLVSYSHNLEQPHRWLMSASGATLIFFMGRASVWLERKQ